MSINSYIYRHHRAIIIIIIIIITIIIIFQRFNSDYVTSLHALRESHFTYHIQGSIGQVFSHSLNSLDCLKSN